MNDNDRTIKYYQENAEIFIAGTVNADMGEARHRFLNYLPKNARILDFGCGSGRDAKDFLRDGYNVDAVDGSEELCLKASKYIGIPVKHMLFQDLNVKELYNGIWACASILHLKKSELSETLLKIAVALKPGGILYTSFKYGLFEGMRNGRHFTDFTENSLEEFWKDVPYLYILEKWITQDARPDREGERWINLLARRV